MKQLHSIAPPQWWPLFVGGTAANANPCGDDCLQINATYMNAWDHHPCLVRRLGGMSGDYLACECDACYNNNTIHYLPLPRPFTSYICPPCMNGACPTP